jgi:hypothetical protein
MATPRKKSTSKVVTVKEDSYSELEVYCIWLNEYYKALRAAGFNMELALGLVIDKGSYPEWVKYRTPSLGEIVDFIEDEDED